MPSSRQARMMRTAISPRFATRTFLNMTPHHLSLRGGCWSSMPNEVRHVSRPSPTKQSHLSTKHYIASRRLAMTFLQRNIPVLLRRVGIALVAEHFETVDQTGARLSGLDDIVNIAAFRRNVRAGKFLAIHSDQFRLFPGRILRLFELFAEDDVDRAIRSHHRDLG